MASVIRPRRVHWPTLFWSRAEGGYADCDLLCRRCSGRGTNPALDLAAGGATVEDAACPSCRSSGLLVPARHVPDDVELLRAADDAGGCWLDWLGHVGDGLLWPAAWCWMLSRRRFEIRNDVYVGGGDVLAFMAEGSLIIGLSPTCESRRRHLKAIFRLACGQVAAPVFLLP